MNEDVVESKILTFARIEFEALGYDLNQMEEDPNKWICENVLELLDVFAKQGHSGSSAPYCVNYFSNLALFKPLSPLNGNDNEWGEVSDGLWQNKRAFSVFKGRDNKAYDINGKVFVEPNGCAYINENSKVYIEFPYIPKTEYVHVEGDE